MFITRMRLRTVASLAVAAAILLSSIVLSRAMVRVFRIRHADKTIVVTGSVRRRIVSDRIVWRATVVGHGAELAPAYKTVAAGVPKALAFLHDRGIDSAQAKTSAVRITEIHPLDKDGHAIDATIAAYSVEQDIEVESPDVAKVAAASRDATQLIDAGIQIQSDPPKYLYTNLSQLKIDLLAGAAKDARQRADQIASNTGATISQLNQAHMGVMQVNAANDSTTSGDGMNDTTSLEKDVSAVVTATFGID
jgi:hypothetical protein